MKYTTVCYCVCGCCCYYYYCRCVLRTSRFAHFRIQVAHCLNLEINVLLDCVLTIYNLYFIDVVLFKSSSLRDKGKLSM